MKRERWPDSPVKKIDCIGVQTPNRPSGFLTRSTQGPRDAPKETIIAAASH
jgi:hypothetical protein